MERLPRFRISSRRSWRCRLRASRPSEPARRTTSSDNTYLAPPRRPVRTSRPLATAPATGESTSAPGISSRRRRGVMSPCPRRRRRDEGGSAASGFRKDGSGHHWRPRLHRRHRPRGTVGHQPARRLSRVVVQRTQRRAGDRSVTATTPNVFATPGVSSRSANNWCHFSLAGQDDSFRRAPLDGVSRGQPKSD